MLPRRKYIKSYVGMGVAVLTRGMTKAIKVKIKSVLTSLTENGSEVVGVELENIKALKLSASFTGYTFMVDGKEYVKPCHVFPRRRQALEYIDNYRVQELLRWKEELEKKLSENERMNILLSDGLLNKTNEMNEALKLKQSRKWNRPKK